MPLFSRAVGDRLEPHARELVRSVYLHLLGREPDEPGMEHWLEFLRGGGSFDGLLDGFLRSPEYARHGATPAALDLKLHLAEFAQRGFDHGQQMTREPGTAPAQIAVPDNRLAAYFQSYNQGPGIWKWWHYLEAYHRHFQKFVGREVHLVEVGVFGGGSLGMWRDYFGDGCRIYGIDVLEECRKHERDGVRILIGDQGDRTFWRRVRDEVPRVDILIDDGSHETEHQIVTLEEMLPHLRPGGVYACEDVYFDHNPFHDYVAGLMRHLNAVSTPPPGKEMHEGVVPNALQRSVHSLHQYPYLTIIEKNPVPVGEFAAPRHGSDWEFTAWFERKRQREGEQS